MPGTRKTPVQEPPPAPKPANHSQEETTAAILRELVAIKERLDRLEKMAHTEHSLGPEVVDHIARHTVTHLCKSLAQSGLPVNAENQLGDQLS